MKNNAPDFRSQHHRRAIFDAIKHAKQLKRPEYEKAQRNEEAQKLLEDYKSHRPAPSTDDVVGTFINKISSGRIIGTTLECLTDLNDVPNAIDRFLVRNTLPKKVVMQPLETFSRMQWDGYDLSANIYEDMSVSLCMADCGIAETGSVVIHSSNQMPVLLNFLATFQIMVIRRNSIIPYLEDYARFAEKNFPQNSSPRNSTFITGASGTTDIEGVLVRGAHGPQTVHILCVES